MSWNGTPVMGCTEIQKFLEKLPPSTHIISSLDSQPLHGKNSFKCHPFLPEPIHQKYIFIIEEAIKGQKTIMVVVVGTVRYEKKDSKPFLQNFLVTAQETKWKIASDCFRFQEPQGQS